MAVSFCTLHSVPASHSEVLFRFKLLLPLIKKKIKPSGEEGCPLFASFEAVVASSFPFLCVMQAARVKFQALQYCNHSACVEKLED